MPRSASVSLKTTSDTARSLPGVCSGSMLGFSVPSGFTDSSDPGVSPGFTDSSDPGVSPGFTDSSDPGVSPGFTDSSDPGVSASLYPLIAAELPEVSP